MVVHGPNPEEFITIEDCLIHRGDGSPPFQANIVIKGQRIFHVGHDSPADGLTLNGRGLIAAPGFIDVHNHTDQELSSSLGEELSYDRLDYSDRRCHNYIHQGVTTIITGNCGQGFVNSDAWRQLLIGNHFGTNIGHLIPYESVREDELGRNHNEKALSRHSIDRLLRRIDLEMAKGALGFSVAFDRVPGCYASTAELLEYAGVVAKYDRVFVMLIRNESGVGIIDSINEAIEIGRSTGARIHLSQFRLYKPLLGISAQEIVSVVLRARRSGVEISASQNPYDSICSSFGPYWIGHLV